MTDRILLIEDDTRLAEMVRDYLGGAGFRVERAGTGAAGLGLQAREPFDAIILDLMLPDMDGLDVCRQIRLRGNVPILMLTARGDAMDRVIGLELGADDYLPKPFEPRELLGPPAAPFCGAGRFRPKPTCCASAGWRSTAARARFVLTARSGR